MDAYRVEGSAWHVTVNVARDNGQPFFELEVGRQQLRSFLRGCEICDAVPHLICLMPDHLHLLVEVRSVGLVDLMRRTKSSSTKLWWRQGGHGPLWQESFHDHGIRNFVDFDAIANYIVNNPVEAGLVEEWDAYPLIAGTLISSGE
jgi:REP element-mobilizing transposase RayT